MKRKGRGKEGNMRECGEEVKVIQKLRIIPLTTK
jgi:hypothetical protein